MRFLMRCGIQDQGAKELYGALITGLLVLSQESDWVMSFLYSHQDITTLPNQYRFLRLRNSVSLQEKLPSLEFYNSIFYREIS